MLSIYHIMLLAIYTAQVKKRVKKDFKKRKIYSKFTKNWCQGDSNPDPQNQLELKVNASHYPQDHSGKCRQFEFKRGIYSFSMVIDSFQLIEARCKAHN